MKLTTPATASAPYTALAPPVSTSTRSTRIRGMEPISTADVPCNPPTWRRPSTSTSVRSTPRPRRLSRLAPSTPDSTDCSAVTEDNSEGRSLRTSASENSPASRISAAVMACTGTAPVRLTSRTILEPVTTTSSITSSSAIDGAANTSEPMASAARAAARKPETRTKRRFELTKPPAFSPGQPDLTLAGIRRTAPKMPAGDLRSGVRIGRRAHPHDHRPRRRRMIPNGQLERSLQDRH